MNAAKINFYMNNEHIKVIYCESSAISYSTHTHSSSYVIGLVFAGELMLELGNKKELCNSGEYFIIQPNTAHGIYPKSEVYTLLSICLDKNYVAEHDVVELKSYLISLLDYIASQNVQIANYFLILNMALDEFINCLHKTRVAKSAKIARARSLLENRQENKFLIRELSFLVSFSTYHLIRSFKRETGLSPHKFQMQNRIRRAQYMLLQDSCLLKVALEVGFYDQSHFNRWFRRIVGITPTEYIQAQKAFPNINL